MNVVEENEIDNMMLCIDLDSNDIIKYNEFLSFAFNKDKLWLRII